jgi:hypothetical protein
MPKKTPSAAAALRSDFSVVLARQNTAQKAIGARMAPVNFKALRGVATDQPPATNSD